MIFFLNTLVFSITLNAAELSLDQFLAKVKEQNISLKQQSASLDAAKARSIGILLPPLNFGYIEMKEEGAASNIKGYELSQSIPFPTKLYFNHSARKLEALAEKESLIIGQNEILANAKLLYVELWVEQERLELLKSKKNILAQHLKLSRATVRSDSFLSIHLLKAESDMDFLENDIESVTQKLQEKKSQISEVINENPEVLNPVAMEPGFSEIPTPVGTINHKIESLRYKLESYKERESEAKSSWLPDFNLRYKEMGATSMSNAYKETMIGVTLPFLYFWEPNSEVKKSRAERLQTELSYNREKRAAEINTEILFSKAKSLMTQLSNLKNKLLPRAEKRMKQVHNLAPRDIETLQDHRETMEAFPELKLAELELRMQYEATIAEISKIISKGGDNE